MRGIGLFAVLAGALSAGCAGGSAGPAMPTAAQAPNKLTETARFEAVRSAAEQQVRNSAPAGFDVSVTSAYLVKRGGRVLVFSDRNVAMKTASANDVIEIPKSFFQSAPRGREVSTTRRICIVDGCPDPSPPDPTPPTASSDGGTAYLSGTTPPAENVASTRQFPCTQTFSTNNYPGGVSMSYSAGNTWTLQYRPGYPNFSGGTDSADVTAAVRLVDGTTLQSIFPAQIANGFTVYTSVNYPGDIRRVKYATIQVVDHVYTGDNVIMGEANVSCVGDSSAIATLVSLLQAWLNPPH